MTVTERQVGYVCTATLSAQVGGGLGEDSLIVEALQVCRKGTVLLCYIHEEPARLSIQMSELVEKVCGIISEENFY